MESLLNLKEKVENKERKFGANVTYFPCFILNEDGTKVPALFTESQLNVAIGRAVVNPEDVEVKKKCGLFSWIFD